MKYENYKEAKSIVEQIQKHEDNLKSLESDPYVVIQYPSGGRIYTIGIETSCEHEYHKVAVQLIETIKNDLKGRIDNLKTALEVL